MTRDTLSSAVDRFYQAFGENNPELLTDVATDDFRIEIPKLEYVPLQHTYVGVAGFKQLLKDREGRIEIAKFELQDRIIGSDAVAVFRADRGERHRPGADGLAQLGSRLPVRRRPGGGVQGIRRRVGSECRAGALSRH